MSDIKLRMTHQRRMILEELKKSFEHPSACELYKKVREKLPHISLGTVYRNLEILTEQGLIRKLEMASGQRRFDAGMPDHNHILCISCGRLDDVPADLDVDLETVQRTVGHATGFKDIGWNVGFHGLCPDCYAKSQGIHKAGKIKKQRM